jgi:hypothetical protein
MESWRKLAIELFPERKSVYEDPEETVWAVIFDLHDEVGSAHETNDLDSLKKIYKFTEWCHLQKGIEPEIWKAAYAGFYEHLVEHEATYLAIPQWVSREVFRDMLPEFEDRLDNKVKYPFQTPGSFNDLLTYYNEKRGTNFRKEDVPR